MSQPPASPAYDAGWDAYMSRGIGARNPQPHGSPEWCDWERGWNEALAKDCGERCRHQSVKLPAAVAPAAGSLVWHNGVRGVTLCRIAAATPDPASRHWVFDLQVEQHSVNRGSAYDAGMIIRTTETHAIPYDRLNRDRIHIRPYRWADPV